MQTKYDKQEDLILSLKKSNDVILKNYQSAIFSLQKENHTQNFQQHRNKSQNSNKSVPLFSKENNTANIISPSIADNNTLPSNQQPVTSCTPHNDSDDLQLVEIPPENEFVLPGDEFLIMGRNNRPLKPRKEGQMLSRQPIFGNKIANNRKSLAGKRIIRESEIFVGGICNNISADDLANYMKHEINVDPLDIQLNKENKYNRSFKITVKSTEKMLVLKPESWDSNIIVKPYRHRRPMQPNNDNRTPLHQYNRFQLDNYNMNDQNAPQFNSRWDHQ